MRKVAVIGAGITGLVVADALRERNDVAVFEKSWGPGGRMATRRFRTDDGHAFADHGAPYVHARTPQFRRFMEERVAAGHAARWGERDGMPAWVGRPHMNTMLSDIAARCEVRFQTRVERIERRANGWHLVLEPHEREGGRATGSEGPFDTVVASVPATQAARLIDDENARSRLERVAADPCWAFIGVFDALPTIGARRRPTDDLEWVAASGAKPGREGASTLVAHATASWSRAHLEADAQTVRARLLDMLRTTLDVPEPHTGTAHRWRYSTTRTPLDEPFLDAGRGLYLCGDWCLGAHAEDGFLSAQTLLDAL